MAKAAKVQKTNAMRELERAGIAYAVHTYEDDGEEARGLGRRSRRSSVRIRVRASRRW